MWNLEIGALHLTGSCPFQRQKRWQLEDLGERPFPFLGVMRKKKRHYFLAGFSECLGSYGGVHHIRIAHRAQQLRRSRVEFPTKKTTVRSRFALFFWDFATSKSKQSRCVWICFNMGDVVSCQSRERKAWTNSLATKKPTTPNLQVAGCSSFLSTLHFSWTNSLSATGFPTTKRFLGWSPRHNSADQKEEASSRRQRLWIRHASGHSELSMDGELVPSPF